jgi:hypothetical protein
MCTWESEKALGIVLCEESRAMLMQQYPNLPPFSRTAPELILERQACG